MQTIKTLTIICLVILALTTGQTLAARKSTSKTKPTYAKTKEPSKLELAKEVLLLTGTEKEMRKVADKLVKSQLQSSKMEILARILKGANVPSEKFAKIIKDIFEHDIDLVQEMHTIITKEYAKEFTAGELKELAAYYKSPTGKKGLKIGRSFSSDILSLKKSILDSKIDKALKTAMAEELNSK